MHAFAKELQHLVCNLSPKTRSTTKLSMSTCQLSIIFRTFAADWKNRDVAQLVAHYVRDVGVACSSHVIPTRESPSQQCCDGLFSCLSVERNVLHVDLFVEEEVGTLPELGGRFGGEVLAGTALGETLVHLWMTVQIVFKACGYVLTLRNDMGS